MCDNSSIHSFIHPLTFSKLEAQEVGEDKWAVSVTRVSQNQHRESSFLGEVKGGMQERPPREPVVELVMSLHILNR